MAFASGPVTFKRFHVSGRSPRTFHDDLIDKLAHRVIGKGAAAADRAEAGWITGDHILDTKFDLAKNRIGDCLLAAIRIDTNKPPADVVRSYQRMHEQALLEQSGREFLSRQERREARQAAIDQAEKEARSGAFRRMQQVPMLWDLPRQQVYLGSASPNVVDRFAVLFKETFGHGVTAATSGEQAYRRAAAAGRSGAFEDLRPAQLADAPADGEARRGFGPSDDPHGKDYLGVEWLTFEWYRSRYEGENLDGGGESVDVVFDTSLQLVCAFALTGTTTIRTGDPTGAPEAGAALSTGKLPVQAGLRLAYRGDAYACQVRADRMHFSGVVLPASAKPANARAAFEERIDHLRGFCDAIDESFGRFIDLRLSSRWNATLRGLRAWIASNRVQPLGAAVAMQERSAAS